MQSSMKFKLIYFFLFIFVILNSPSINLVYAETGNNMSDPKAGKLFVLPDYGSFLDKDKLTLNIFIDPQGQEVNAADIRILFPPELLKVESIDYTGQFCELIAKEEIDNQAGEIRLTCGTPSNTISTTARVAQINFSKLDTGWATLSTSESRVLAANGLGTNILKSPEIHRVYLTK